MPLCEHCGKELPEHARKCSTCGRWSETVLLGLLHNPERQVRIEAINELAFVCASEQMVLALANALHDADAGVRQEAGLQLFICGKQAGAAISDLVEALADEDVVVRRLAAATLSMIGPPARSASPALAKLRTTTDEKLKVWVLEAERTIAGA
jgi:HEAT repeat protein